MIIYMYLLIDTQLHHHQPYPALPWEHKSCCCKTKCVHESKLSIWAVSAESLTASNLTMLKKGKARNATVKMEIHKKKGWNADCWHSCQKEAAHIPAWGQLAQEQSMMLLEERSAMTMTIIGLDGLCTTPNLNHLAHLFRPKLPTAEELRYQARFRTHFRAAMAVSKHKRPQTCIPRVLSDRSKIREYPSMMRYTREVQLAKLVAASKSREVRMKWVMSQPKWRRRPSTDLSFKSWRKDFKCQLYAWGFDLFTSHTNCAGWSYV